MTLLGYVMAGGALGAAARYGVGVMVAMWLGQSFPYATLLVNVLGSFLMGMMAGMGSVWLSASEGLRAFLMIGCLGGFTTFSAFTLESVGLIERGQVGLALLYISASVMGTILAFIAGMVTMRLLAGS